MNHASGGQWNLGIRMKLVGRPTRILLGRKLKYSLIYPLSLTQVSLSTSGMFQTLNICAEPFTSKDDICAEPFIIRQIECIIRQCGGLSGRPATSQKESHEDQRGIKELAGYLLSVLRSHDPPGILSGSSLASLTIHHTDLCCSKGLIKPYKAL